MREIFKKSDSVEAKFSKSACFNSRSGTLTKKRRQTTFKALQAHAKSARWGAVDPANLTAKQMKGFIQARLEQGISARTMQTEMSHLRVALEGVGRVEFAQETCANKELAVPSASRIGTGRVVDPDVLRTALEAAQADTKALIQLSRSIGLREKEAVLSADSLREWDRALASGQPLVVRYGTKGKLIRSVFIRPGGVKAAQEAVKAALAVVKEQKKLVVSKNLKSAVDQHSDRLARVGLKGENSGHSLRRAFAMDQYLYYLDEGCSQKIALARVSSDLGHGDGRGRWVFNNYLRASL
jgi:site-specific recombinase XerC